MGPGTDYPAAFKGCGEEAANAFCQMSGYEKAEVGRSGGRRRRREGQREGGAKGGREGETGETKVDRGPKDCINEFNKRPTGRER